MTERVFDLSAVTDSVALDQCAVVTGGGSGIGRAIAHALAESGFRVAVIGRRPDQLDQTRRSAGDILAVPADITDAAEVTRAFDEILEDFGRLDLLVNNAGVFGPAAPLHEVTDDQWESVLATNLTGAFRCTRRAVAQMIAQRPHGGRIVNIGSISAHRPRPNNVAYAVSKHAMTGLTRATALEGREHRVLCTQIDVGNARTAMSDVAATGRTSQQGSPEATFDAADIGTLVATIAQLPLDVSIDDMSVFATDMPYLGRG